MRVPTVDGRAVRFNAWMGRWQYTDTYEWVARGNVVMGAGLNAAADMTVDVQAEARVSRDAEYERGLRDKIAVKLWLMSNYSGSQIPRMGVGGAYELAQEFMAYREEYMIEHDPVGGIKSKP